MWSVESKEQNKRNTKNRNGLRHEIRLKVAREEVGPGGKGEGPESWVVTASPGVPRADRGSDSLAWCRAVLEIPGVTL